MTDRERAVDKAAKLKAHAESAKAMGSEQEAQAFSAMVQRLLIEHALSEAEVDAARERATAPEPIIEQDVNPTAYGFVPVRRRVAWMEQLAWVVARAHLCKFLVRSGSNRITFVGAQTHATVAAQMFGALVASAEKIAARAYHVRCHELLRVCHCGCPKDDHASPRLRGARCKNAIYDAKAEHGVHVGGGSCGCVGFQPHVELARGFKQGFLDGFIERLGERYDAERKTVMAETDARWAPAAPDGGVTPAAGERGPETGSGARSQALVVLNSAIVRVDEYLDEKFRGRKRVAQPVGGRSRSTPGQREGETRGRAKADTIALKQAKALKGGH